MAEETGLQPGKKAYFSLARSQGGAEKDLSSVITSIKANLKGHGLVDVTTMGSSGHKWSSDQLEDNTFTIDMLFDAGTDLSYEVLEDLRNITEAVEFTLGPIGSTSGNPKITGQCWVENFPLDSTVGDMVKITGVSIKVENAITVGTFT